MGTFEAYGSTVINGTGDSYREIAWSDWNALTPAQQQAIPRAVITNVPGVSGKIRTEFLKTLWVNPSPTSAFATQTITLASDDYDYLLVSSKCHCGASIIVSFIAPKGHDILTYYVSTSSGTALNDFERLLTHTSDTNFSVAECTYQPSGSARSTNNDYMIPLAIYGFKKDVEFDLTAVVANVSTDASKCMLSDGVTSVENSIETLSKGKVLDVDSLSLSCTSGYSSYVFTMYTHGVGSDIVVLVATGGSVASKSLISGTTSTNISSITYNNVTQKLDITFAGATFCSYIGAEPYSVI